MGKYENGNFTRKTILDISKKLFLEKGFHETSNEDICRAAHVNRSAIRYHFRDKENLRYEVLWQIFMEYRAIASRYCQEEVDRRIVTYVICDNNNNTLVFDTVYKALRMNPDMHPLFHSDRGFQYTNRAFHNKLESAEIMQSVSRVSKCIVNGSMEGFWEILKRECYYGKRFTNKETFIKMIKNHMDYYNNKRLQRNLGVLTPMEKHEIYLQAA